MSLVVSEFLVDDILLFSFFFFLAIEPIFLYLLTGEFYLFIFRVVNWWEGSLVSVVVLKLCMYFLCSPLVHLPGLGISAAVRLDVSFLRVFAVLLSFAHQFLRHFLSVLCSSVSLP